MDGVIFRELPKPELPNTIGVDGDKGEQVGEVAKPLKTPPLSIYKDVRSKPYTAEYFNLPDWEHWNVPKEIATIEEFVLGEIKDQSLTDTVDSYREIVDKLETRIGKRENEKVWHKLDRLVSYIKAVQNARKWSAKVKEFEAVYG